MRNEPGASPPIEWLVSNYCEAFGCTPGQAVREIENDPIHLGVTIMGLRQYANVREKWAAAKSRKDLRDIPDRLIELVESVEEMIVNEDQGEGRPQ